METTSSLPNTLKWEFVVLVPHQDCLPALDVYRHKLFVAGFLGAYAFPAAAPLALLNRPLSSSELKAASAELRMLLGKKKIVSTGLEESSCWKSVPACSYGFFGHMLDMPFPALPADAAVYSWKKPILAPALLAAGEKVPVTISGTDSIIIPDISFRAAALANLTLMPVLSSAVGNDTVSFSDFDGNYSFTWELGPLHWLPRK